MENQAGTKCVAYCRYSSYGQNPLSIEQQKHCIVQYAKMMNFTIVKWFKDEAKTGTNAKRDGYIAMLDYIAIHYKELSFVVVDQVDRLHRNVMNYYSLKKDLTLKNMDIRSVKNEVEDTVIGHLTESLAVSVAQYLAEVTGVRAKQRLIETAEKAQHCGGTAPLGYDVRNGKLVINKLEAPAVKEIFLLYNEGYGYKAIAQELNRQGYLTKKKQPFVQNSIRDILFNEKYMGTFIYNKAEAKQKHGESAGKRNTHKNKADEDIIRIENDHPAIISKELFFAVQEKLSAKGSKNTAKDRSYLLRGMIHCKDCGATFTGDTFTSGKSKKKYSYYRCPSKEVGKCSTKKLNRWILDKLVTKLIFAGTFAKKSATKLSSVLNQKIRKDEILNKKLEMLSKNIADQERKLGNLTNTLSMIDNEITRKRILNQMDTVNANMKVLQDERNTMESLLARQYTAEEVQEAIRILPEYIRTHNTILTRRWLQAHVHSIDVDKNNVEIKFS